MTTGGAAGNDTEVKYTSYMVYWCQKIDWQRLQL